MNKTLNVNAHYRCIITKFICIIFTLIPNLLIFASANEAISSQNIPIFATHASEHLQKNCQNADCLLDILDGDELSLIALKTSNITALHDTLALSHYEVLIGTAVIAQRDENKQEAVFEFTTTWRNMPIDDITISLPMHREGIDKQHKGSITVFAKLAQQAIQQWTDYAEDTKVFNAQRIYELLEASNYGKDLLVPNTIGEFHKAISDVYRDPLRGSITRYLHPQFDDAILDISVYPISPFTVSALTQANTSSSVKSIDVKFTHQQLNDELNEEKQRIQQTIEQANIQDYLLSDVESTVINVNGTATKGYRLSVLLNQQTVPVYSTQYVFMQNDKIIKLTGNVPDRMMVQLVQQSLKYINVPKESPFMQRLRKG